jgi:sugar diacid utilization regulator
MGVGQSQAALVLLHEHITSKRSRNVPIASLEPVMLLLVEQSVEQKKGKLAKDALYQYKNISQNTNVGTIEVGAHQKLLASQDLTCSIASFKKIHRVGRRESEDRTSQSRRNSIRTRNHNRHS